jgi:hypothetical protein
VGLLHAAGGRGRLPRGLRHDSNHKNVRGNRSERQPVADRNREGRGRPAARARRTLVASCFRGALPPVDLRAVCLVRAMAVLSSRSGFELEGEQTGWGKSE